jgi:uncharacterized protein (TIGR02757 family)
MITKEILDELVIKYETSDFIKNDPIQFPHRGKSKEEIELYGFIASLFSYGNRSVFIKKLDEIFSKTEGDLVGYIKNGDFSSLKGIEYRFSKENDIIPIFQILNKLYLHSGGLESLFRESFISSNEKDLYQKFLYSVVNYFYENAPKSVGNGFYHMIPNPKNGGAMKRINMFLRWMVRKSEVDLGIWGFMKPKDLLIPLDVHVSKISREMGLLNRKCNDFKAVWELMGNLREFCPEDPVKYDFAMFAFGIELSNSK